MKHLIIFLNYYQSRLDNPVYRLFATESLYRRNATLLFLTKPLDERELLHEVTLLRNKQNNDEDITFHICANLLREEEGSTCINTLHLIRKTFTADFDHHYPSFAYCMIPDLGEVSDECKKTVWRNLVEINNAVSDHIDCRLLSTIFLYNDYSQKSLAEFIFNITHSNISFDRLSSRLPVKQTELFTEEDNNIPAVSIDFPPIFGAFNTKGLYYPEQETRTFLHHYYIDCVLKQSKVYYNDTQIELCNEIVNKILSNVPLQTSRVCLQDDMFIRLSSEDNSQWTTVESFWNENVELQLHGLSDYPKEDWLLKIRQRTDTLYQGRFREIGTEYFFKLESKKTTQYNTVLSTIITEVFAQEVQKYPFTPDAQKTIVRGLINALQLKVMEIQNLKTEKLKETIEIEQELMDIKDQWNGLNIFSRMMGKDSQILTKYREVLTNFYIQKTIVPGCDFAIKLLNELIPEISSLIERCDMYQNIFDEALASVETLVKDTNPSSLYGIFGEKDLAQTMTVIETDKENLLAEYVNILQLLSSNQICEGDALLSQIRQEFNEKIDKYIDSRIEDCSIPPVLGLTIIDRIERFTNNLGGFRYYVDSMRKQIPVTIKTKQNCKSSNKVILIAPELAEQIDNYEHLLSDNISHIQLLNLKYGLTLQDLDGFAGQKMFVEPSIF